VSPYTNFCHIYNVVKSNNLFTIRVLIFHINQESPWGPLNAPVKPPVQAVEAQTVSIDLVAEFFPETKKE